MKKRVSFVLVFMLLLQMAGLVDTAYASPANASIDCSAGSSSVAAGSTSGSVVDSGLTLTNGVDLTGAKVYITDGFDAAADELVFTNTTSISGIYVASTGVLTLTGTASPADYQAALRTVRLKTALAETGDKTVVFSLGNKLEFGGHYYECVTSAGISWTNAKNAAAARKFFDSYGDNGYLATITSAGENAFLTEKLAADA